MLQGDDWAQFQKSLGKDVYSMSGEGWLFSAVYEKGHGKFGGQFSRLYAPYGPFADSKDRMRAALIALEELAESKKVDYIRVEPMLGSLDKLALEEQGYIRQVRDLTISMLPIGLPGEVPPVKVRALRLCTRQVI
jgi:hypothetical protein